MKKTLYTIIYIKSCFLNIIEAFGLAVDTFVENLKKLRKYADYEASKETNYIWEYVIKAFDRKIHNEELPYQNIRFIPMAGLFQMGSCWDPESTVKRCQAEINEKRMIRNKEFAIRKFDQYAKLNPNTHLEDLNTDFAY